MKNKLNTFIAYAKNTKLSEQEKENLTMHIHSYMRFSKVIHENKRQRKMVLSPWRYIANTAAFTLIVLIIGGSTLTYAAQDTVPGNVLYPLKVRIAEPIEERLAVGPEAKALVQVKQVSRRIDEARTLVERNDFSEEKQDILDKELDKKVEKLSNSIATLTEAGQVDKALAATAKLQPALEIQKEILTEISNKEASENPTQVAVSQTQDGAQAQMSTMMVSEAPSSKKDQANRLIEKVEKTLSAIDNKEQQILAKVDRITEPNKEATEEEQIKTKEQQINLAESNKERYAKTLTRLTKNREAFTKIATQNIPETQITETEATSEPATIEEPTEEEITETNFESFMTDIDILTQILNLEEAAFLLDESLTAQQNNDQRTAIQKITEAQKLLERVEIFLKAENEKKIIEISTGATAQESTPLTSSAQDNEASSGLVNTSNTETTTDPAATQ